MYNAKPIRSSTCSMLLPLRPLVMAAVFAIAGQAYAAVSGGAVAAGAATISTNGAITTINQSTDRAIINWKSFDIGAGERVDISQPNKLSATLNRVNSTTGTRIDGTLTSNGQVYVVNPNGIVVGKSGHIRGRGGVALSTLDISDAEFMQPVAGSNALNFHLAGSSMEPRVVNDGAIFSMNGRIALVDGEIVNGATGTATVSLATKQYPGLISMGDADIGADSDYRTQQRPPTYQWW